MKARSASWLDGPHNRDPLFQQEATVATTRHYVCYRPNESGGPPERYSCTLELTDDALIGSSGPWRAAGPSPAKVFVAQSGKWFVEAGQVILNSDSGVLQHRFIMRNVDDASGSFTGDGLVGGGPVTWVKA